MSQRNPIIPAGKTAPRICDICGRSKDHEIHGKAFWQHSYRPLKATTK